MLSPKSPARNRCICKTTTAARCLTQAATAVLAAAVAALAVIASSLVRNATAATFGNCGRDSFARPVVCVSARAASL